MQFATIHPRYNVSSVSTPFATPWAAEAYWKSIRNTDEVRIIEKAEYMRHPITHKFAPYVSPLQPLVMSGFTCPIETCKYANFWKKDVLPSYWVIVQGEPSGIITDE